MGEGEDEGGGGGGRGGEVEDVVGLGDGVVLRVFDAFKEVGEGGAAGHVGYFRPLIWELDELHGLIEEATSVVGRRVGGWRRTRHW